MKYKRKNLLLQKHEPSNGLSIKIKNKIKS
jgi:hypothetical protein